MLQPALLTSLPLLLLLLPQLAQSDIIQETMILRPGDIFTRLQPVFKGKKVRRSNNRPWPKPPPARSRVCAQASRATWLACKCPTVSSHASPPNLTAASSFLEF